MQVIEYRKIVEEYFQTGNMARIIIGRVMYEFYKVNGGKKLLLTNGLTKSEESADAEVKKIAKVVAMVHYKAYRYKLYDKTKHIIKQNEAFKECGSTIRCKLEEDNLALTVAGITVRKVELGNSKEAEMLCLRAIAEMMCSLTEVCRHPTVINVIMQAVEKSI